MNRPLTNRQRKFVNLYNGNATEAARLAGYSKHTASEMGYENLRKPQLKNAIREREVKEMRPLIANRTERQQFWTDSMRDASLDMNVRQKASELLGKSEADFIDRVETTSVNVSIALTEARQRLLANSLQKNIVDAQVINTKQNETINTSDCTSLDTESKDALEKLGIADPLEIPDFLKA